MIKFGLNSVYGLKFFFVKIFYSYKDYREFSILGGFRNTTPLAIIAM